MNPNELCFLSALRLSHLISTQEVSPVEVVEAYLDRIQATESILNSFITLPGEEALQSARQAEREIRAGHYRGPLHGIPVGLKDLYYVKGVRNTAGSKIYDTFIPDYDGTIVARFKQAGAILMGKLNLHQFAYGPMGENPDYGDMHNPWDTSRIAGGSSGGSASAVAAGQCAITMGTDTGGSVRIPSALCGVAGIKPTYGLLSRHGLTTLSWSMDHPGPMARTVEDCAMALDILAGHDPLDPTSAKVKVPNYSSSLIPDIDGIRIGVPKENFEVPLDPEVRENVLKAVELLERLGAKVTEVSWPIYHYSAAISTTILGVETTACHQDLLRLHGDKYDPWVRTRLEAGFFISGTDYLKALQARAHFINQTRELLRQVDILVTPTEPTVAPLIGSTEIQIDNSLVGIVSALTQYTRAFNITGFPAMSIPCGFSAEKLPIGLQLAGRPFDEVTVLKVAYAYQQATDWHTHHPPL